MTGPDPGISRESRAFCETAVSLKLVTPDQVARFEKQWPTGFKQAASYFLLKSLLTPKQIEDVRSRLPEDLAGEAPAIMKDDESILMMGTQKELDDAVKEERAIVLDVTKADVRADEDSWIIPPEDAGNAPARRGGGGWIFATLALLAVLGLGGWGVREARLEFKRTHDQIGTLSERMTAQEQSFEDSTARLNALQERVDEINGSTAELRAKAAELEKRLSGGETAATGLEKRLALIEDLGAKQQELAEQIGKQLAEVARSVEGATTERARLRQSLDSTAGKLDSLMRSTEAAGRKIDDLAKASAAVGERIGKLDASMKSMDGRIDALKATAAERASLEKAARWMESRAGDLHRSARSASVGGDDEGALAESTLAVRLDPTRPEHLLLRSEILSRLGRHAEASEDARAALRLTPTDDGHLALGVALAGLGRHADALKALDEAARRGMDEARILEHRAGVHEKLGNTAEAARDRKRLADLRKAAENAAPDSTR